MTVLLRPHHLLCLLTYEGKGYSSAFTENFDAIAGRVSRGEEVLLVDGPDDICAPLLSDPDHHCCGDTVTERDRLAVNDIRKLDLGPILIGAKMVLCSSMLRQMREAFAANLTRAACAGCQWGELCSSIASCNYIETALLKVGQEATPV